MLTFPSRSTVQYFAQSHYRLIATTGLSNAGIDSVYAKSKGIIVSGTSGALGQATLEHIWALILATVRYITVEDANVKSGNPQWQSTMPLGLAGRTLGLVGVGKLGTNTGKVSILSHCKAKFNLFPM
jgi:26S proteasome regulatory subunit N2